MTDPHDGIYDQQFVSKAFKAVANKKRLAILRLLRKHQRSTEEIVSAFSDRRQTTSRHLAILKDAGVVMEQKTGGSRLYKLNNDFLSLKLREVLRRSLSAHNALADSGSLDTYSAGSVADERKALLVSATEQLRTALGQDPELLYRITAQQFELFICDRLDAMGLEVRRTGHTFAADGGVDIVAWPKKAGFPYLLAVQAKHRRRPSARIGPGPVKDLLGVLQGAPFDAGVLITNTSFTANARWFAHHGPRVVRLRDLEDLRRWIAGSFLADDIRDLPAEIELTPGIRVKIL